MKQTALFVGSVVVFFKNIGNSKLHSVVMYIGRNLMANSRFHSSKYLTQSVYLKD